MGVPISTLKLTLLVNGRQLGTTLVSGRQREKDAVDLLPGPQQCACTGVIMKGLPCCLHRPASEEATTDSKRKRTNTAGLDVAVAASEKEQTNTTTDNKRTCVKAEPGTAAAAAATSPAGPARVKAEPGTAAAAAAPSQVGTACVQAEPVPAAAAAATSQPGTACVNNKAGANKQKLERSGPLAPPWAEFPDAYFPARRWAGTLPTTASAYPPRQCVISVLTSALAHRRWQRVCSLYCDVKTPHALLRRIKAEPGRTKNSAGPGNGPQHQSGTRKAG